MHAFYLGLDTQEGTYQIGCLAPNPNNKEPQPALAVQRFVDKTDRVNINAIPKTVRPLVVMHIEPEVRDEEDDSGIPDFYRVYTLPILGSEYDRNGIGVITDLDADVVLRAHMGLPIPEMKEMIEALQTIDEEEEKPVASAGAVPQGAPPQVVEEVHAMRTEGQ